MPEVVYPWGYAKRMVNISEIKRLGRFDLMEYEFAQRLEAWIISRGGHVGIGSAYRTTQPVASGFAPDGASFHQMQTWADGTRAFAAVDLVCVNGENVHRSPRWDEVPRQGSSHPDTRDYGVHCNVKGEPWHMQPMEVDGHATWVANGRPRPNPNFPIFQAPMPVDPPVLPEPIPEPPAPVPDPPVTPIYPVPAGSYTMPPLSSLRKAAPNNAAHVQVWQAMMNRWLLWWGLGPVSEDGNFGDNTEAATILFQTLMRDREGRASTPDGVVGPQSWGNVFSDC